MWQMYGQKNKPTTSLKMLVGLEHIVSPFDYVDYSTRKFCSDGKGRDKELNVQGKWGKSLRKVEEGGEGKKWIFFVKHPLHSNKL